MPGLPDVVLSPEVARVISPKAKRELQIPANCPQPVLEMVAWLKSTGTGQDKLQLLLNLGCKTNGTEEYLAQAKTLVGEGTLAKVEAYIKAAAEAKSKPVVAPPADESKADTGNKKSK